MMKKQNSMSVRRLPRMGLLLLALLLAACSGGGGGQAATTDDSSNWDRMVWDRDNWA